MFPRGEFQFSMRDLGNLVQHVNADMAVTSDKCFGMASGERIGAGRRRNARRRSIRAARLSLHSTSRPRLPVKNTFTSSPPRHASPVTTTAGSRIAKAITPFGNPHHTHGEDA